MRSILHILTRSEDALAAAVIAGQRGAGERVDVFDLTIGEPDYGALVARIFAADSVETW